MRFRRLSDRQRGRAFIDGRTELYGEKFFVDHNATSGLMEPENLFRQHGAVHTAEPPVDVKAK